MMRSINIRNPHTGERITVRQEVENVIEYIVGPAGPQGPRGKPFEFSDFTAEQLAMLKGPKGDKGQDGQQGPPGPRGLTGSAPDTSEFMVKDELEQIITILKQINGGN